ncbi:hypothetical protein GGF32_006909 [Allomyces javanicus]|nr:hypothetical protein GGF32_006909 [Allomyces javanicus]
MAMVSNPFLDRHPAMSPPPTMMDRPPPAPASRTATAPTQPRTPSPAHLQDQEEAMRTYEHEFHAGLRQVRDAYAKLVAARDADVLDLRTELARKDAENKELAMRIAQLEAQLGKADKRVEDLTRTVTKLHQFRQQVFESFVDDDSILSDAVVSGTMLGRRVSIGLGGAGNASAMSDRRLSGLLHPDTTMDRPDPADLASSDSSTVSASPIDDYAFPDSESPNGDEFETVSPTPAARNVNVRTQQQQSRTRGYESRVSPPPPPAPTAGGTRARDAVAVADPAVPRSTNGGGGPGFAPVPGSHTASAPPPPRSRTASSTGEPHTVDARDFFRVARRTLSYDEFTALLHHVKAFNARHQSRSDTLHHLYELLAPRHVDLYAQFERILSGARRAPGATRGGSGGGGSSGSDA